MICGFLGSGKTSFSKQLEARSPAVRFTHDDWMIQLYGCNPPADSFAEYASRVSKLQQSIWARHLEVGGSVILDSNFWSRDHRDQTRQLVAALGAACERYYITCDEATARQRVQHRNSSGTSLYIGDETFTSLKARWEPPGEEEQFLQLDCNDLENPNFWQNADLGIFPSSATLQAKP